MKPPIERQEITAGEAGKILGISRQSVLGRVNAGTLIPAGRTSEGVYIFIRRDIEGKRDAAIRQASEQAEKDQTAQG